MSAITAADSAGTAPTVLASIWRYKVAVVIAVVLAAIVGYYASLALPPIYETTATILLSDSGAFDSNSVDIERKVQQEANRVTSQAVVDRASEQMGSALSSDELLDQVTVDADPAVGLLTVTAESGDPDMAAQIANSVTEAYEHVTRQANNAQVEAATKVLQGEVDELRSEIKGLQSSATGDQADAAGKQQVETLRAQVLALETRMSEVEANAALQGATIGEIEQAIPPTSPSSPQPARNAVVVGTFGLGIASALAYWRAGVIDRAKLAPTTILGAPLLAEIPDFERSSGGTLGNPLIDPDAMEAYQFLVTSFEYTVAQSGARSILITSASPGDGKSLTAIHLARALAMQGRNVMLVDSDLRARGLTTLLNADDEPGLVALAAGGNLDDVVRHYRISHDVRLSVVPAGTPPEHPTGLLASDRYREAIAKIAAYNDLTIVDGAPLLTVADASAVAAQVAGVLLVVDAKTAQEDLLKVRERLWLTSTPLLGYVLNRVPNVVQFQYPYGTSETPQPNRVQRALKSL